MATRAFTDRQGDGWKVWETIPQDARGCLPAFAKGWLTFEHATRGERRRLAPIPEGWADAGEERLMLMCRVAEPVRTGWRNTPPLGVPVLPDEDGSSAAGAPEPA
jgi:hypothetical protein